MSQGQSTVDERLKAEVEAKAKAISKVAFRLLIEKKRDALSDKGVIYYLDCFLGFSFSPFPFHLLLPLTRQHFLYLHFILGRYFSIVCKVFFCFGACKAIGI